MVFKSLAGFNLERGAVIDPVHDVLRVDIVANLVQSEHEHRNFTRSGILDIL